MDEDRMEEDDAEVGFSSVVVIEKKDLDDLTEQLDEDNEEGSPQTKKKKGDAGNQEDASLEEEKSLFQMEQMKFDDSYAEYETIEEPMPSTSAAADSSSSMRTRALSQNPDDNIRNATSQYLQGQLSLTEFAAAVDDFGRFNEDEDSKVPLQASLVLLNPDTVDVKPETSTTREGIHSSEDVLGKLKGEFFRTGDDPTTFSVRRKRKMPPTIKNMMGEAHVRFAGGDLSGAESICLEIIKEQPTYKDPFHTLAMIYDGQGKVTKSLQFFLICGLLDPKHFDDWPRLAELSIEENNVSQAIMCLTKAIMVDPTNVNIYIKRSELMADANDYKGALRGYYKVLQLADKDGVTYMDVSKRIAAIQYKTGEVEHAYETLWAAVNKFSNKVTGVELNLLVEVCISLRKYVKAVTLFMGFSGVRFEPPVPKQAFKERIPLTNALGESNRKCVVPIGLHADLIQKLCIVLIHLEAFKMVEPILENLHCSETIEDFGLQFYEIAEAYMAKEQRLDALQILSMLIRLEKYNQAEIWLRYAECLFYANRMEESVEAYSEVLKLAPDHKLARLNLAAILQRLGKYDVALQSLHQHAMEELIDQDLMVEKCKILLSRQRIPEFYESALQLFSKHCPEIRNQDEVHAMVITSHTGQQLEGLKALRARKGEPLEDEMLRYEEKLNENLIGEWTVYLNLLHIFLKMHRVDLYSRVTYTAWASQLFSGDENMKKDMDFHCALAAILSSDTELTPYHIRTLFARHGIAAIVLNLMSLASRRCGHTRYGRQIVRLLMKHPNEPQLMMLSAHNSFMNGTYKYALMEYFALLKVIPNDPLVYLMISSTLLHISSQKFTTNRSQLMVHAVAFLNRYAEIRGDCQETFYNMGRLYHYMGLFKQAMTFYKRVLITPPVKDKTIDEYNISDLKREAAFNIAQIYKACNCWELAQQYIHRYITI